MPVPYVNFMLQMYNGSMYFTADYQGKAVVYGIPLYQQVTVIANMSGYDTLV